MIKVWKRNSPSLKTLGKIVSLWKQQVSDKIGLKRSIIHFVYNGRKLITLRLTCFYGMKLLETSNSVILCVHELLWFCVFIRMRWSWICFMHFLNNMKNICKSIYEIDSYWLNSCEFMINQLFCLFLNG